MHAKSWCSLSLLLVFKTSILLSPISPLTNYSKLSPNSHQFKVCNTFSNVSVELIDLTYSQPTSNSSIQQAGQQKVGIRRLVISFLWITQCHASSAKSLTLIHTKEFLFECTSCRSKLAEVALRIRAVTTRPMRKPF